MPHSNPRRPPAGPLAPPPAPPTRRRTALIVLLGLFAAALAVALTALLVTTIGSGGNGAKDRDVGSPPAATPVTVASRAPEARTEPDRGPVRDVKIDSCGVDPTTRWPSAELTLTNSGERTTTYIASIEFLGPTGTRLAEGAGISYSLAPGQRAEVKAGALARLAEDEITCKVIKVTLIAP
ncbi:hypothetical protein M8Z33_32925 [Streptomyces sp. ZAF1911]|uniref:hypothetical protein n=1 Tax=Streptomyces sp. ZAF1911 TaxID=2944129 RepID=UPI00237A1B77|nr:hypothetical protein [Streptomyces sp. ZAF1911]MDD9381373.1 hypothetical protein [Streptomyces sp. ZAF1911]